ncbi:MAG: NAD-dependent epimerase/dehydratase family protein [Bacteroidetes bacterium]|nr:NAD-dependent epimerase/dehydratase family protein [Bacteroidota bacterium]
MKVLITGGAGYIGTGLIHKLAGNDKVSEIIVYDNLSRPNYNLFLHKSEIQNSKSEIRFVFGDILDSRKLREILKGVDVVYHLAAKVTTPFANTDPHFFEQVNHWGTAELVYAIEDSEVSKLVYTSSTSIYGASDRLVDEDSIPNPRTYYGISKLRGEEHVRRLNDKINTIILRCGNVYGYNPSMRFDAVINHFMFDAHFKNRIQIQGNGKQTRAFIHIEKVDETLAKLLETNIPSGVYNLSDKNMSVLEVVDVIKEIYPELEFIFINQHMDLRELHVNPKSRLYQYFKLPETNLKDELIAFRENFAFKTVQEVMVESR